MTGSAAVRFGILLYVNRSGSTLLSRLISDACDGVFVFPELGFIVQLLMAAQARRVLTGDRLFRLIEDDPRRSALTISAPRMAEICRDHDTGDIGQLLLAMASAASHKRPDAILIKHEKLAYLTHVIPSVIDSAQFIHIIRDPRAVVSSMLRTPVPEKPGFDMARGSILFAARHWRDYVQRVEALAEREPVLELRYEDLGQSDGRTACARVAEFLGVSLRFGDEAAGQLPRYRIAAIDRALHARVYEPFDAERSAGWRAELTDMDVRRVEATCGRVMMAKGYPPVTGSAPLDRPERLRANLGHVVAMLRHIAGTARHYARRPDFARAVAMHLGLSINKLRRGGGG